MQGAAEVCLTGEDVTAVRALMSAVRMVIPADLWRRFPHLQVMEPEAMRQVRASDAYMGKAGAALPVPCFFDLSAKG